MIGGERKGGALAPLRSRLQFFILSRARRSPEASGLRGARDREMISKDLAAAGLKPRPSLGVVRSPD